jgi:drug/metabolite transporter (DMT)-like permease
VSVHSNRGAPLGALTAAARRRRSVWAGIAPHLVVLTVTAIWGLNAVVLKVGLSHVRPVPFTTARFLVGSLFLALVALALRLPVWKPPPLRFVVPGAVVGFVTNQIAFTSGLSLSTAVDLSLIMGLGPILAALVLFLFSRRAPSRRQYAALLLGLVGVLLVVLQSGHRPGGSVLGDLIGVGAPLSWAFYLLVMSRAAGRTNPFVYLSWASLVAALILLPAAIWISLDGHDSWSQALLPLAYASIMATGVAYSAYFWAVPRLGVTGTALYTYLQPVMGAAAGSLLLHEEFGWGRALGAALIVIAAYLGASGLLPAAQRRQEARAEG